LALAIKSFWLMALVLATLMVAASLDAAPDPPAINPHAVDAKAAVKATILRDFTGALRPARLDLDAFRHEVPVPVGSVQLADIVEPEQPSEGTAMVSQGSDPSPPAAQVNRG
jgi:hypothetical protein